MRTYTRDNSSLIQAQRLDHFQESDANPNGGDLGDQTKLSLIFATPTERRHAHQKAHSRSGPRPPGRGGFLIRGSSRVDTSSSSGSNRSHAHSSGGGHAQKSSMPEVEGARPAPWSSRGMGGPMMTGHGHLGAESSPRHSPWPQFPPIPQRKISDNNRMPTALKNFLENPR